MAFQSPSSGICDMPGSSAGRLFAQSTSVKGEGCSCRAGTEHFGELADPCQTEASQGV
jgi:hypothetical protein